ncbi:transcriptional regulator ATRX homolog [Ostrea edulis]|uniref:transcriptional regulator ATRX homolog n=1 Tax=Ostrea edulis TaxID=37623 RepID=UPI0024AF5B13|nr:transcriptional regulator ATRX homolog [Ostrea edulis]
MDLPKEDFPMNQLKSSDSESTDEKESENDPRKALLLEMDLPKEDFPMNQLKSSDSESTDEEESENDPRKALLLEMDLPKEDFPMNQLKSSDSESTDEEESENDPRKALLHQMDLPKEDFPRNRLNTSDMESKDEEESKKDDIREGDVQENPAVRYNVSKYATFAGLPIKECFEGVKVKAGQRVVRGRDWENNNDDGGEGNIGTVTYVNQDTVMVQWDSQKTSFEYRIGKDRKFDLRLYDNAQTGVRHVRFRCNGCYESPIIGMKW